ncbi:hypothetical protein [Haladaptatus sp. NG-SE-30]
MVEPRGVLHVGVVLVAFTVVLLSVPVLPYLYDSPLPKVLGALGLGLILLSLGLQTNRDTS